MLKIKNLFQKKAIIYILPVTILFFVLLVVYFPSFNLQFSLLDDGLTARNARLISESFYELDINKTISVLLEPENGRVRPAYWLLQSLLVFFSGYDSGLMHFYRFLILLVTLFFANKILIRLNVHKNIRMLMLFIYGFNFQNLENYYRLGPTEPFLVLYYVLLTHLLFFSSQKFKSKINRYSMFLMLFLFGIFTKESFFLTALPWIFGTIIFYVSKKKDRSYLKRAIYLTLITIVLTTTVFVIRGTYPEVDNYSSNYELSPDRLISSTKAFWRQLTFYQPLLIELSVLFSVYLLYKIVFVKKLKNINFYETAILVFILQASLQFAVLLPWKFALDRYLAVVNINLILIYGYVFMEIYKLIKNKFVSISRLLKQYSNIIYSLLILILLAQFVVRNYFANANYQLFQKVDSEISSGSVQMLSNRIPKDETVYVNYEKGDSNIEIYKATSWHLEEFYKRKDIAFEYLDQENLCTDKERYIFDRRSVRYLDPIVFNKDYFTLISSGKTIYEPVNYGFVIRSFYYQQKLPDWNNKYLFDWNLYIQDSDSCIEELYI